MKTFLSIIALLVMFVTPVLGDEYVQGYYRSNGTYVQPYVRSSPNGTVRDNYSYKGNVNPSTGAVGTNIYSHDETSPYYTGPDSHGNVGHSGYNTVGSEGPND